MYSWMEFLTRLEPGIVLALVITNFRFLKTLRSKNFLYTFLLFAIGLLALHFKQLAGMDKRVWDISIADITMFSNAFIILWSLIFIKFCKTIFNVKINNDRLSKNMNALLFMVFFLLVVNFLPMVEQGTKDTMTFATVAASLFICFAVGSIYREVQFKTSSKYCFACMLAAASFVPMFLFDVSTVSDVDISNSFVYSFVAYGSSFLHCIFFFVFLMAAVDNVKYLKEKRIKIQKRKQAELQRQAEERHFKEASEQAHRMKIIEQEKEMEANLLLKMTARGKAIQRIADKASAESESKSGYIAFLSHEVRTPLNGIMGMVRMLANTTLDNKQHEFVDNLSYSGEALLALLNDVLDYSKLSSGHMELENIGFDVKKFLDNIIVTMTSRAEQQGIELTGECGDQVPEFIKGDPTRLRQVMLNLIGNSIKFTKQGGVYVSLKEIKSEGGKCKIRSEIRDTGIGIPEAAQDKLFQEFVQVDSSTTRNFGGTGLGLSICKKLVTTMGGEIGVISTEGKGSTFWWEAEFDIAEKGDEEEEEQRTYVATQKDKSYEVLVVEDDQISQQVVGSYLSSNGQLPKYASDGESAIRMVDAGKVDFVFLDMGLPDMNGLDVCKHIREKEETKDMPVVALTGNVSEKDQAHYISEGVNFCLGKPISPEDVQQALFQIFKLLPEGSGEDGSSEGDDKSPAKAKTKVATPVKEKKIISEKVSQVKAEEKEKPSSAPAPAPVKASKPDAAVKPEANHIVQNKLDSVLIAEDDLISQKIIEGYLKNDAHTTAIVGDGKAAVEAVQSGKYDVVLMDINMPVMDGIEATKTIRALEDQEKATIPIIAITGNVSEEDIDNCRDAGMNDFVAKPVDPDYLRGAIMRIENVGRHSSDFAYENINKNLEKNQIPVPKHKNPIPVEVPASAAELNRDVQGLPYVLVIEDDPISQKIVAEYLASFEYNPVVAGSAEEGLELLDKSTFLAVLMDIDLPGMSGLEATKSIRGKKDQLKAHIPVIAITGNIKQEDVEACREAGMNDFIGKPINPNYLKGALERNRGSVEHVDLDEDALMKHLDTEVLNNLKKSFSKDVFQGLIAQFSVSAEEAQKVLLEAVSEEDRDKMRSQAHLLKGMSRNIGLKIVGNFMEAIEKGSKSDEIDDIKDMTVEADEVLEEGKAALSAWFEKWKSNGA